jgi:uncharacterized protein (TIGR03086 family)
MADTDPLILLSRALDQAAEVIAGVGPDRADSPTPCRSWNARTVVDHLVQDLDHFATSVKGGEPDWGAPTPSAGDHPAGTFRSRAGDLLELWRGRDLAGTMRVRMGEVPATFVLNQQLAELAVHTWDLVRATGQRVDLDPDVAQTALDWAGGALQPEFRGDEASGKAFGPQVPAPPDAPVYDRLAAFFGRDPAAAPTRG